MGHIILMNCPWASFVMLLCVVNLSIQTSPNALEESFKELSNLILGKWADLEYKITEMYAKLRKIDSTIENDIKQRFNDIEAKVEGGACGQEGAPIGSEDSINQIQIQTTEIVGEIKHMKRETSLFNTVVNSLTLTSNSLSSKLDNIENDLNEGIQDLKTPLEELKQVNQGRNACDAAVNNITLGQNYLKQSMNVTLEGIKELSSEMQMYNSAINDLTISRTEVRTQLEAIKSTLNSYIVTVNSVVKYTQCNGEFFLLGSECFSLSSGRLSWQDARENCKRQDGDLAQPKDVPGLLSYLQGKEFSGSAGYFWIGGSDIETEGTWNWLNGTSIKGGWASGQPYKGTSYNCLRIDSTGNVGLYGQTCSIKHVYICERQL